MTDPLDPTTEAALAGLREPAPPGLAHAALVAVGLADDYAVIDSPVGPDALPDVARRCRPSWPGRSNDALAAAATSGWTWTCGARPRSSRPSG